MEYFSIISRIEINNQSIEQCQIIHEKYVVTTTKGRTILYLPAYDSHFIINKKEKLLQKVDLSIQIQQMEQLKNIAGEIFSIDEAETLLIAGFKTKCKSFQNISNGIKIQGKIYFSKIDGIEQTAWEKCKGLENKVQLFTALFDSGEFIFKLEMTLNLQGNINTQKIEVLNVEKNIENIEEYEDYLN